MTELNNTEKTRMQNLQWAIRHFCFEGCGETLAEVRDCNVKACPLFNIRATVDFGTIEEMTAGIREYCRECIGDSRGVVRGCPTKGCHLHAFRLSRISNS